MFHFLSKSVNIKNRFPDRQVQRCDNEYSYCQSIIWNRIKNDSTGRYECRTTILNDESYPKIDYLNITVNGEDISHFP